MKVAVDAMGGDFAPSIAIEGIAMAVKEYPEIDIYVVGHTQKISYYLAKFGIENHPKITLVHAESTVEMSDKATIALKKKKDSSMTVAAELVKSGTVGAVVSAGNTGAAVATMTVKARMLPGIERPAIATLIPAKHGHIIMVDAGANPDCKAKNLAQFAILGETYAKLILDIDKPKIGLLNVGEEEGKGNELTKEAYKILSKMPIDFHGNIEAKTVFNNVVDVVVCDGFVGNVFLKTCEGLAKTTMHWLKDALTKNAIRKTGALIAKNAFKDLKAIANDEEYGGAPLLGTNGICIIGHGSSSALAIKNAIKVAANAIEFKVNDIIKDKIARSDIDEIIESIQS